MNKCDSCALNQLYKGVCSIFRVDMTGKDGCPYYASELKPCDICGSHVVGPGTLVYDEDNWHLLCETCGNVNYGTCQNCTKKVCRFKTDQSINIPPVITVQKRQGNMVVQTQQKNPERVKTTCMDGCPCWREQDGEGICMMDACGSCENYQAKWRN